MPPKKGKPKGGGKGKKRKEAQTEEQKRKIAEQKALAEKEKLVRRQQLTNAFLKLKRDKEYDLIKLNENKLLDLWRPRLRKMKIAELMEDYKVMQHTFERAYEKKQNLIKNLDEVLNKNEGDYDRGVDMHMHNIDKMMEFYRDRMKEVKQSYLKERQKLLDILHAERKQIEESHEDNLKELRSEMDEEVMRNDYMSTEMKQDLYVREEEMRNKSMEDAHAVKVQIEAKMNEVWNDIQQRLTSYEVNTHQKRQEYIGYKKRDEKMSALIDSQFRKLYALREGMNHLGTKKTMFNRALDTFMDQLIRKKIEYRGAYNGNMNFHKKVTTSSHDAIRHLAIVSRSVIEKVDALVKERQKLLLALNRCSRGERLDEKLNPFVMKFGGQVIDVIDVQPDGRYSIKVSDSVSEATSRTCFSKSSGSVEWPDCPEHEIICDPEDITKCKIMPGPLTLVTTPLNKILNEFDILDKFWIRFNRVCLEKSTVQAKRAKLLEDNFNLRLALRNYMGGLNPGVLDVNQFSNDFAEKDRVQQGKCHNIPQCLYKWRKLRRRVVFVPSEDCNL